MAGGSVRATGFCYPWTGRRQPDGTPTAAAGIKRDSSWHRNPRHCGRGDDDCHLHHRRRHRRRRQQHRRRVNDTQRRHRARDFRGNTMVIGARRVVVRVRLRRYTSSSGVVACYSAVIINSLLVAEQYQQTDPVGTSFARALRRSAAGPYSSCGSV